MSTFFRTKLKEGTPSYMAPECFCSNGGMIAVSRGTDVWSLGIILFEMVVGHTPFHSLKGFAKCCAIVNGEKMPLDLVRDPVVLDIIKKCLQRSPDKRPSTEQIIRHPFLAVCKNTCCISAL